MPSCGSRFSGKCCLPIDCSTWDDDGEAWLFLEAQGFTEDRFLIKKPSKEHELTDQETAAVCFLLNEWDWGFEGGEV